MTHLPSNDWLCLTCDERGIGSREAREHAWTNAHRARVKTHFGSTWTVGPRATWVPHGTCHHKSYQLTCAEFDALLDRAEYRCEICSASAALSIDHDHTNGRVRGLVCPACNSRLGQVDRKYRPPTPREASYLKYAQGGSA